MWLPCGLVGIGSQLQQELYTVEVLVVCGKVERGVAILVGRVQTGAWGACHKEGIVASLSCPSYVYTYLFIVYTTTPGPVTWEWKTKFNYKEPRSINNRTCLTQYSDALRMATDDCEVQWSSSLRAVAVSLQRLLPGVAQMED